MWEVILSLYKDKIIFVPSCLLCPVYMVKKERPDVLWREEIVSYLNKSGYSMIQMPCPEASFPNYNCGIKRIPHGIKYYERLMGFKEHCYSLGNQVISQIVALYVGGYSVTAIMGIEHSPTCATSYMYTSQGTQKRQGIYTEYLSKMLKERGYQIPLLGINRRFPQKAIKLLCEIEIGQNKELDQFG